MSREHVLEQVANPDCMTTGDVLKLPYFAHLKASTLDKWRYERKGPPYLRIGRKAFYRLEDVLTWIEAERERQKREHLGESKPPALPAQAERQITARKHRLGAHKTKRDRLEAGSMSEADSKAPMQQQHGSNT